MNLSDNMAVYEHFQTPFQAAVDDAFGSAAATFKERNRSYGDSFANLYDEIGMLSVLPRIDDKYQRAKQLIIHGDLTATDGEKLEDTLSDLATYCLMAVAKMREAR